MFRGLYDEIHGWNEQGASLYWSVLLPWIERHQSEVAWLAEFANRIGNPIPPASTDELQNLYSLQRVNEVLTAHNFQGEHPGMDERRFRISMTDYVEFFSALGFRVVEVTDFAPLFHEIFEVIPDNDIDCAIGILEQQWPLLMLGSMVFARAGVVVVGGANHVVKQIAETSTMFWAFRRNNRPTMDLSVGWGSNSQWRTSFRRDYVIDTYAYFNVDSRGNSERLDHLTPEQVSEVLMHRCLIRSAVAGDDELWPYDDKATSAL